MSVEREILIAVLKLTKTGPTDYSLIGRNARIPAQTAESLLTKLADAKLIKWREKILEASPEQRVKIAVQALKLGADSERVCRLLEWKEFESITTTAFEIYNYYVVKNFRYKGEDGKRWEIDILGFKKPTIAAVDCKLWRRNWTRASIVKTVEEHVKRTQAFADTLSTLHTELKLEKWEHATVIPIVLSLLAGPFKFHYDTPIVPVLQLQNFLNELPTHIDLLTRFKKKISERDRKITEYQQ
ncbi:MAG: hypothetical protein ACLFU9_05830 [Candidatus Bathyarchaeia archaeon]